MIYSAECEMKPATLKQVQKQMKGFDESLVMYMYHHLNGREEEARTYLAEWEEEQEELKHSFSLLNDLQKLNSSPNTDTDDDPNQQYTPSDPNGNSPE